jgi:spore coat polysaccharide biosynthesis protein SpsF
MRGDRPAELVVGSVQLGLDYGAANRTGKPARETALRLVKRAADAGVAAFDTARAYGDAEERLGEALCGRKVRTITKLSPLSDLTLDASPATVKGAVDKSVFESLSALQKSSLDCLLLHRAAHMRAFDGAVWKCLNERVAEGRIAALGVSVQSPAEARAALAEPAVKHIQLAFNLLDWRWREDGVIAAVLARSDVSVHARSVFLQGVLAAGDPDVWPRIAGLDVPALISWIDDQAWGFGRKNAADLCLAYVRGQNWIDGVVIGMETEEQLEVNLSLSVLSPLSAQDCTELEMRRPRVPAQLLDPAKWPSK